MADLGVGDTGVGFADVQEAGATSSMGVADGEGVVGEEAATLAVPVFGGGDDNVEGGEGAF